MMFWLLNNILGILLLVYYYLAKSWAIGNIKETIKEYKILSSEIIYQIELIPFQIQMKHCIIAICISFSPILNLIGFFIINRIIYIKWNYWHKKKEYSFYNKSCAEYWTRKCGYFISGSYFDIVIQYILNLKVKFKNFLNQEIL